MRDAAEALAQAALPPVRRIEQRDTHRLIPSKYSDDRGRGGDSVLTRIVDDDAHLQEIFDLDNATNDRLAAENNLLPGIGLHELVSGFPNYRIVNAAFCHAHPLGSRFNGPDRGAWYAGFDLETSRAEVAWHKTVELAEVGWSEEESITYDDYLADFTAEFHDLQGPDPGNRDRGSKSAFAACLDPNSYVASQTLAARLLRTGALGIIYPSVRHQGGTCLACFRPALVNNVRKHARYRLTWKGGRLGSIKLEEKH